MADPRCESAQLELSSAYDQGSILTERTAAHIAECDECASFSAALGALDTALASGRFDLAPDVVDGVMMGVTRSTRRWWAVAAVALVGLTVGALLGTLGSRVDVGLASELHELLFETGSGVHGIEADLVVVERGVHPDVPERVYNGSIDYVAPESLAIELVDTTSYPSEDWVHNDLLLVIDDGDTVVTAGTACPVAALPGCLTEPRISAVIHQPPFVEGTLRPLEIVGPGRSVSLPNDLEIVGTPELDGRKTVQVETTVAGAGLLSALTDRGSWRELHPTDPVIMWLDTMTLVPLRIEVFAADSPQRELWQIRRGYDDSLGGPQPIFIVSLERLVVRPGVVDIDLIDDATAGGFVDGAANVPRPSLPPGFEPHRSGHWLLPNGERVDVASWSDGRSWLKIEATRGWDEQRLFGMNSRFVEPLEVSSGLAYLSPNGDTLAIHGEGVDVVVSGSMPRGLLEEVAASLEIVGAAVPDGWVESTVLSIEEMPSGVLAPVLDGWSALARIEDDSVEILLTGGGERSVLIRQTNGSTIALPVGPDVSAIEVRGQDGRFDSATGVLSWVEDGTSIEMLSETVAFDELLALVEAMTLR